MDAIIFCLVDERGIVHVKEGASSYAEIADACGLEEQACQRYRFDLESRRLSADAASAAGDEAVHRYLDRFVGTPERLMKLAAEGRLPKPLLASLVALDKRPRYLNACAAVERGLTENCTARHDACLESGCSAEGEICLQPLLAAEVDYHKAIAAEWMKLFENPADRIDAWKN